MTCEADILNAIEAEIRATIDDMIDNPNNYFSLEGMEDEAAEMDRDEARRVVAERLAARNRMV